MQNLKRVKSKSPKSIKMKSKMKEPSPKTRAEPKEVSMTKEVAKKVPEKRVKNAKDVKKGSDGLKIGLLKGAGNL